MSALQQVSAGRRLAQGQQASREAVLAEFDRHLDNLKRCVHWLIAQGVAVIDVDLKRGRARPIVEVAASPYLQTLFKGDCANVGRRQEGVITRYRWQAVRFAIAIVWDEVEA